MNTPQKYPEKTQTSKKKKPMSIDALIKAVRDTVVTEADIKRLEDRLTESERKFEEESRRKRVTEEFLQRRITI